MQITAAPRYALLPLLAMFGLGAADAQPSSDRAAWLADYSLLKQSMERDYSNLAWFASNEAGVDLPDLDRRTTAALAGAQTREQARAAVTAFVQAFHDGHFSVLAPPPTDAGAVEAEPAQRDLARDGAAAACAALGYANRSPVAFSLPFESLAGFELVDEGAATSFRSGIVEAAGTRIGILRLRNFGTSQYPAECERAWKTASVAERRDPEAFEHRVEDRWLASLAAAVSRLRRRGPSAIIVDVGSNSGGSEIADWAARLFTDAPLRSAPLLMTSGPLALEYLDEEAGLLTKAKAAAADSRSREAADDALRAISARRAAAVQGCALNWVWNERRAWNSIGCSRLSDVGFASGVVAYQAPKLVPDRAVARRIYWPSAADEFRGSWPGPTFVLTNGTTYSAAEMFAAVLQNNRAAKIVGTRTGGDGCGFMIDTTPLTLPALGLRLRMANCVRLRSDGTSEVAGISPDLAVAPRQGESPRARAVRVLKSVQAELARIRAERPSIFSSVLERRSLRA
jgi:hypothetical protein